MKRYQLTDQEFEELMDASKPVPYLVFGGVPPDSPREKAERIWRRIAQRVGCKWESIKAGDSEKEFIAEEVTP